jgi:hypothetical protein
MSESYTYFMIPFDAVPANPSYPVWYAVKSPPNITWSTECPNPPPDSTWVVGRVCDEAPAGMTIIARSGKPSPPPVGNVFGDTTDSDFHTKFEASLNTRGAE